MAPDSRATGKKRIVTMSTRARLLLVVALFLGLSPAVAGAARQQMFGLLFPELPPYDAPDHRGRDD
jgi:hypothetical protein